MNYKYGIGVMSLNIIDACIEFVNEHDHHLIFIPSRRQVDYIGGYVNNWTTETFSKYVKTKTNNILLKRDHGGPNQGLYQDDGLISLYHDCNYFDAIHIDPWKNILNFKDGCEQTKKLINYCFEINDKIIYEVGKFSVIQSGTSLKETKNTGSYDKQRLTEMISICHKYNMISKEHNGDYLPVYLIKEKFNCGLDCINIAPEFGQIETITYLNEISNSKIFDTFFDICYQSKKWEKWVDKTFNPIENKEQLIKICGHYVLSDKNFIKKIKNNLRSDIDIIIKNNIIQKLKELYGTN